MKYLFKLAFQNIMRAKRRTILTFLVLSFGIMFYIIMEGLVVSFAQISITNMIDFDTGDFKIRNTEFEEDKPYALSNYIGNYQDIETILNTKDYVTGYTERINFLAEIDNFYEILPILAVGVNIKTDPSVFSLTNFFEEGGLEPGGIVLGKDLAEDMEIYTGDLVYLTFRDIHGAITSQDFIVTGFINSADPQVNNSSAFINLNEAQEYLGIDTVTEISVKTVDYEKYKQFESDLADSLPGYQVNSWRYIGREMIDFMRADRYSGYVFVIFIIIVALAGTINTMLLSVLEKRREIGMLKALGMTDKDVKQLFLLEGAIIGLFGSLLGIILGMLCNLYFIYHGFDFTSMMGSDDVNIGYRVMGTVKSEWVFYSYLFAVVISVITTTLASIIPAKRTTRMEPVECLRVTR